jgi:hypothetical protein
MKGKLMPLPSRRQGEKRSAFVSRCVSFMTKKGEGKTPEQRVAICNTRAHLALTDSEAVAIAEMWTKAVKEISDLSPPLKKKKKDKFRITKEDGSGTDDTMATKHSSKPKKKKKEKSLDKIKKGPYASIAYKVHRVSYVNGHSHTVPAEANTGDSGETSYDHGHSHSWTRNENGHFVIKEAKGHIHY